MQISLIFAYIGLFFLCCRDSRIDENKIISFTFEYISRLDQYTIKTDLFNQQVVKVIRFSCCYFFLLFSSSFFIQKKTVDKKLSTVPLDTKYENIRSEAIQAGLILKETDEKIDEIIYDSHLVKSHAQDIRMNVIKFYRNLMKSERLKCLCQIIFICLICLIVIIFIGKSKKQKTILISCQHSNINSLRSISIVFPIKIDHIVFELIRLINKYKQTSSQGKCVYVLIVECNQYMSVCQPRERSTMRNRSEHRRRID